MTNLLQAAKQILIDWESGIHLYDSIENLRQAIAQAEQQEPVAVVEITYGREPECYVTGNIDDFPEGVFKLYAAPVSIEAAVLAEREACAVLCEEIDDASYPHTRKWPSDCAAAIRARGDK